MAFRRENSNRPLIARYNSIFLGHPPDSTSRAPRTQPPLAPTARALPLPPVPSPRSPSTTPFAIAGSFCSERASRVYRVRRTRFVGLIQFTYRWPMSHSFVFLLSLASSYVSRSNATMLPFLPLSPPPRLPSPLCSPHPTLHLPLSPRDRFEA